MADVCVMYGLAGEPKHIGHVNRHMNSHTEASFTLIEVIIVMALVAVMTVIALLFLNPKKEMERAWDTQRKHDLTVMQKTLEDYYNDKDGYPSANELCDDAVVANGSICSCHVCGLVRNNFGAYLPKLHCDPEYPRRRYLFQFSCSGGRQWYRICSHLESSGAPDLAYNYGIGSPNTDSSLCRDVIEETPPVGPLPTATPVPTVPVVATNTPPPSPTPSPTAAVTPVSSPSPTTTAAPTPWPSPTIDPNFTQYYCSTSGCKPCNFTTNDCNSKTDLCEGGLKLFQTYDACYTSRFDPVNGCHCP